MFQKMLPRRSLKALGLLGLGVFVAVSALLVGIQIAPSLTHAQPTGPQYTVNPTRTGYLPAGKKVSLASLQQHAPLTPAQVAAIRQRERQLANVKEPTPYGLSHVTNSAQPGDQEIALPSKTSQGGAPGPLADSDLALELDLGLPPAALCGGCHFYDDQSPSVAAHDSYIVQVGNNYSVYSTNGGSTWGDFGLIGSEFAGSSEVIYEPGRNLFIYEQLRFFNNAYQIFLDALCGDFSCGCSTSIDASTVGLAAGDELEHPDLQFGTDDTYLTFDAYNSAGIQFQGSAVLRLPTDALTTCTGVTFNSLLRTDVNEFMLVSGGTEALNFASNTCLTSLCTTGSQIVFFNWPESSSSYGDVVLSINPYNYLSLGTGNCASQDGVVHNWCFYATSRRGSAYLSRAGFRGFGGQVIGFAWNAAPDGGHPQPYVVRNYFVLPTLTYKGSDALYNPNIAILYPSVADTPYRGYVGSTFMYGGGTNAGGISTRARGSLWRTRCIRPLPGSRGPSVRAVRT